MEWLMFTPIRLIFWCMCADFEWNLFKDIFARSGKSAVMDILFMAICVIADYAIDYILEKHDEEHQ